MTAQHRETGSRRPTISDVARLAGVSKMTVSRVVRGSPHVSAVTRAKVLRAVEELDYYPSSTARALTGKLTGNVALVTGHAPRFDDFFNYVARAAERSLAKRGYSLILVMQPISEGELPVVVREQKVDGLLLGGPEVRPSLTDLLRKRGVPFVMIADCGRDIAASSVCAADYEGAYKAVRHLVKLGHRRIGFVGTREAYYHVSERYRGYLEALREADIAPQSEWHAKADYTIEDGCRATRDLLAKSERPTAVFYSGDLLAIGGLMAAEREGFSVPGDFSVVGFDDVLSASVTSPPLTTVRVDKERIGQTAVQLLFRLMENPNDVATVYVPTELIVRGSTAPLGKAVQEPEAV